MPFATRTQKQKNLRVAFKAGGGIVLSILGAAIFGLSSFYLSFAFSKGLIPEGIFAALIAVMGLILAVKGVQFSWESWISRAVLEQHHTHKKKNKPVAKNANSDIRTMETTFESETDQITQEFSADIGIEEAPGLVQALPVTITPLNVDGIVPAVEPIKTQEELPKTQEVVSSETVVKVEDSPPVTVSMSVPMGKIVTVQKEVPLFIPPLVQAIASQENQGIRENKVERLAGIMAVAQAETSNSSNKTTEGRQQTKSSTTSATTQTNTTSGLTTSNNARDISVPIQSTAAYQIVTIMIGLVKSLISTVTAEIQQMISPSTNVASSPTANATPANAKPEASASPTVTPSAKPG